MYADSILVQQGDEITQGQHIADMGYVIEHIIASVASCSKAQRISYAIAIPGTQRGNTFILRSPKAHCTHGRPSKYYNGVRRFLQLITSLAIVTMLTSALARRGLVSTLESKAAKLLFGSDDFISEATLCAENYPVQRKEVLSPRRHARVGHRTSHNNHNNLDNHNSRIHNLAKTIVGHS